MNNNNISVATALEKNRLDSDVPFLLLLDIDVVDPANGSVVETLHVVRNNEDVVHQGVTYSASIFDITFSQEAGSMPSVNLTVTDYTSALMDRMERYNGGVGFNVTMSIVNGELLDEPPEVVEYFEILAASASEYRAEFQLGGENESLRMFPPRRQTRDFCQNRYKDPYTCGYGSHWLKRVDVTSAGSLNTRVTQQIPASAVTKNVPIVASVYLGTEAIGRWMAVELYNPTTSQVKAKSLFKRSLSGALVVSTSQGTAGWKRNSTGGGYRIWVRAAGGYSSSTENSHPLELRIYPCYESNSSLSDNANIGCAQVEFSVLQPTDWKQTATTTVATNVLLQSNDLTQGVWSKTGVSVNSTADQLPGANTGSLESCDLTLQGSNGCGVHNNTLNFGAFYGINSNGFVYV